MAQLAQQRLDKLGPGLRDGLMHRRQRRVAVGGQRHVVIPDNGHVVGYAAPARAQGLNYQQCKHVAAADDRVEAELRAVAEIVHHRRGRAGFERRGQFQRRVHVEPSLAQRLGVALAAQPDFRQFGVTDEGDALAAQLQQMARCQAAAEHVVAANTAIELLRHLTAPDHQRQLASGHLVELLMLAPLTDQDHANGLARVEPVRRQVEVFGIDAREQHVVATVGQRIGDGADDGQEERVRDVLAAARVVRHDDGHRLVLL
mmetsp:Transcript_44669/g.105027  ORF Transcript_44669/g.105027 Transcript_44669/m.105027 type:complete len:259 (-) Transcript_44669:2947-3723(-)